MSLSNREELKATLEKASQPSPEQQQMQQATFQAEQAFKASQTSALEGQASESNSRAQKYAEETRLLPMELEVKKIEAATKNLQNGKADDQEFARRVKLAEILLKEREVAIKEKDTELKGRDSEMSQQVLTRIGA